MLRVSDHRVNLLSKKNWILVALNIADSTLFVRLQAEVALSVVFSSQIVRVESKARQSRDSRQETRKATHDD